MISAVVVILGLIVVSVSIGNGEWGTAAIFGGIALIILLGCALDAQGARAHFNWTDYWARGGPNGREKHRERSDYRMTEGWDEPEGVSNRELRKAAKKRAAYIERVQSGEDPPIVKRRYSGPARVCHYCGRFVTASGKAVETANGSMIEYACPKCGRINRTKLGA